MEVTPIREADASPITPSKPTHARAPSSGCSQQIRAHMQNAVVREAAGEQAYLCDLDHNVGYGPQLGELMPVLDTHATIFSRHHDRILLPSELASVMGLDTHERLRGGRKVSSTSAALTKLPVKELKTIVGNAVHIPTLASWVFCILANCRMKPRCTPSRLLERELSERERKGERKRGETARVRDRKREKREEKRREEREEKRREERERERQTETEIN